MVLRRPSAAYVRPPARQFGLRAYDSVHLAAAERVLIAVGGSDFVFMGFDAGLNAAADALGMKLLDGIS